MLDDGSLADRAHDVLSPWLADATSRGDVDNLDILNVLRGALSWNEREAIDALAPTHFTFARGRRAAIDYLGEIPKVSVRAQDAYGTSQTPAILDGAVTVAVELLSPAGRPIQITANLADFWQGSWSEVRKDMAGRYPKHDWPEHPGTG
jgi:ATP-dependent helicase HrpB